MHQSSISSAWVAASLYRSASLDGPLPLSCGIRVAFPLVGDENRGWEKGGSGQAEGSVLGVASPWRRRAIRPPARSRRKRAPRTTPAQIQWPRGEALAA